MHVHKGRYTYSLTLATSGSSGTPKTMSTLSSQISAFKYHSQLKKPGLFRVAADSRAGTGNLQEESGYLIVPDSRKVLKEQ